MEKVENAIIAISGQPVTGKGTNVKALIEKLKKIGYKEENIHLESTGQDFRRYFNTIIEFIKNIDNPEIIKELSEKQEIQAIMSNSEYRNIFAKSIAEIKNNNTDLSDFTIEKANNMEELKSIRKIVDTLIDEGMEKKGKEINEKDRLGEIWIIDSRLAFHNIPDAFSVRLTSTPEIAAKRLLNDNSRGKEDRKYKNEEEAKLAREKRRIGENERYKQRYGVDLESPENYDLIIDTSYASIDDISDTILTCLESYLKKEEFSKEWTSPKTLLPLQSKNNTLSINDSKNSVEIIDVDNCKYIITGANRNFEAAHLGKTLVPYTVLAKDDEQIPNSNWTARKKAQSLTREYLKEHENIIDSTFSYEDIYPGIYEKAKENEEKSNTER